MARYATPSYYTPIRMRPRPRSRYALKAARRGPLGPHYTQPPIFPAGAPRSDRGALNPQLPFTFPPTTKVYGSTKYGPLRVVHPGAKWTPTQLRARGIRKAGTGEYVIPTRPQATAGGGGGGGGAGETIPTITGIKWLDAFLESNRKGGEA